MPASGRPRPDSQGRGSCHTLTLAEAQQLAEHLTWTTVRHRAGHLPSTCGTPSRPGFSTAAFRGRVIDELNF
jgi:hypothetical protein